MPIAFTEIPSTLRVPIVSIEFDNSLANRSTSRLYRALIIAQKLDPAPGTVNVAKQYYSQKAVEDDFGKGSMAARMYRAYRLNDPVTDVEILPLADNPAGVKAAGSVLFAGSPTEAGTLNLYIDGVRVQIGVGLTDDPDTLAAALASAIQANDDLPVTTAVNGVTSAQVDITAKHKGETGNDLSLLLNYYTGEKTPSGITVTLTQLNGGTANPDISSALAGLSDEQYHIIANPYTDAANLSVLESDLLDRWGALRMIEGVAITAAKGDLSALSTLGNSRNSWLVPIMGTGLSPTAPVVWAAACAGAVAFSASNDESMPLRTVIVEGVLPPARDDRFDLLERNSLLWDGISTYTVDASNSVRIEKFITTYKTNPVGEQDDSYLYLENVLNLAYIRWRFRSHFGSKYARYKLADDGARFGVGQKIVTPRILAAEAVALYQSLEEEGRVENSRAFAQTLLVERNAGNPNRADFLMRPDLINQLDILGGVMQFIV